MAKGIIYVCSTAVQGLIKIGKTTNFQNRMKILEDNGYRNVTGLKREFAIELDNPDEIEILLQDLFAKSRVSNTELFSLDLDKVIQLLSSFQGRIVYPVNQSKQEVFDNATENIDSKLLPNGTYFLKRKIQSIGKNVEARMVVEDGKLILKAGSTIAPYKDYKKSITWIEVRQNMRLDGDKLLEDVECSSVSMASALVVGFYTNGWTDWKTSSDVKIAELRRTPSKED